MRVEAVVFFTSPSFRLYRKWNLNREILKNSTENEPRELFNCLLLFLLPQH